MCCSESIFIPLRTCMCSALHMERAQEPTLLQSIGAHFQFFISRISNACGFVFMTGDSCLSDAVRLVRVARACA